MKTEKFRKILRSGVAAREPVQEGGENVHLGGQDLNRALNKPTSFPTETLDQGFNVINSRTIPCQDPKTALF